VVIDLQPAFLAGFCDGAEHGMPNNSRCWWLLGGDSKIESGSFFRDGFNPDLSPVSFDDFFADCQPNAGSRILAARMQSLEDHKNTFRILRTDPDAVILYPEQPFFLTLLRADMDRGRMLAAELDGIADQVLEEQ